MVVGKFHFNYDNNAQYMHLQLTFCIDQMLHTRCIFIQKKKKNHIEAWSTCIDMFAFIKCYVRSHLQMQSAKIWNEGISNNCNSKNFPLERLHYNEKCYVTAFRVLKVLNCWYFTFFPWLCKNCTENLIQICSKQEHTWQKETLSIP